MATTLTRWNPLSDMAELRNAMDRMFDSNIRPVFRQNGEDLGPTTLGMDVTETNDEYVVTAAVPGIAPEDVNIEIEDDTLTISGEFTQRHKDESEQHIRQELRYGSFKRALRLPPTIEADKAEANFEHGVLRLVLPKKPEARSRTLKITPNGVIEQTPKSAS
jgi:HSP20 family protein